MTSARRPYLVFAFALAQLGLVGWLDYVSSYEVSLSIFYYIPIAYAAWQLGTGWSALISVGCAVTLTWTEVAGGRHYSSEWIIGERALMRIFTFGFVAYSFGHFRRTRERDRQRIQQLEGLLTFCTCCHKLRDAAGNWIAFDEFLRQNPALQTQAKVCPTCARAAYAETSAR